MTFVTVTGVHVHTFATPTSQRCGFHRPTPTLVCRPMIRSALAVLLSMLALAAQAAPPLSPADHKAILAIAGDGDAAWNARDAKALAATFTIDGDNRIVGTAVDLHGREAIEAYFAKSLSKVAEGLRHRTTVDAVTPVSGDVAVADIRVSLEQTGPGDTVTVVRRFTGTAVVVRDGGAWKIRVNRVHLETGP